MAKKFDYGKGIYYFNVNSAGNSPITIKRLNKKDAEYDFIQYQKKGKRVEWLGKWVGKKFEETTSPLAE